MITTPDTNRWLRRGTPNPNASLRCFCLPYAGGSARIFQTWSQSLPENVEVCALELPGHGMRLTEQPFDNWDLVLEAISQVILPLCDRPFVFFGHSMGALISFELARYCRRHHLPMPSHLYVSGYRAPQLPDPEEPVHNLPEQAFREKLTRLQGTPPAVLNNMEVTDPGQVHATCVTRQTLFYSNGTDLSAQSFKDQLRQIRINQESPS
ncbi:thioesterase II family protein [Adonisia turfae]|uniref:thioesterase II family protein n=1 Tax=Adonisia turfae TaxID=2950184 RepID=UPI0032B3FAE1